MNTDNYAIYTQALTKKFGSLTAVDGLDLNIEKGSIYGFLGPNGCGKSTTIRMLCGLLTPTSGTAEVMGFEIPKQAELLKKQVGYMTQKFSLYGDLTVIENLKFMGQIFGLNHRYLKTRIEELVSRYSLVAQKSQRVASMSGGQKQRLALAASVLHKPSLLFLDEPTSAVDPENRRDFWEKLFDLSESGTTILVSTHYMDEAERCHKLAILERGAMKAEGTPEQLMHEIGAQVVEVKGNHLRLIKSQLLKFPEVKSVAQQGIRLRVLVNKIIANPIEFIQAKMNDEQLECNMAHPSLEDVFVTVTGNNIPKNLENSRSRHCIVFMP
jgi:ABC-2 type transport system ATP-binding protein